MLRGALKTPTPPKTDFSEGFGLQVPQPPVDELAIDEQEMESPLPIMEATGTTIKDDLNSIVETNPDAAANVLRSWLSDAA